MEDSDEKEPMPLFWWLLAHRYTVKRRWHCTLYIHNQHLSPHVSPCATQCNHQTGMDSVWEWLHPLCSQSQVRRSWNLWLCKDQTGNSPDGQQKQNHEQNISMHNETIILCLIQKMPSEKEYCIVGKFEGENFHECRVFVAIRENFHCKIWGHDVLWHGTSEQSAKVFSAKVFSFESFMLSFLLGPLCAKFTSLLGPGCQVDKGGFFLFSTVVTGGTWTCDFSIDSQVL